jgi:hypothetical protein
MLDAIIIITIWCCWKFSSSLDQAKPDLGGRKGGVVITANI